MMVIPCFECGDDVPVDEEAEMEAALCPTCISDMAYWGEVVGYTKDSYSIADYDGYQYNN